MPAFIVGFTCIGDLALGDATENVRVQSTISFSVYPSTYGLTTKIIVIIKNELTENEQIHKIHGIRYDGCFQPCFRLMWR